MFENGSYLRRRKRFKLPRKGQGQIKDITAMAMADLQHYEASQRKAMLAEQAKLRSLAAAVATTSSPNVFNNLSNLSNLNNLNNLNNHNNGAAENDLLKLTSKANCSSPMSVVPHHQAIAQQQQSNLHHQSSDHQLSQHHQQLINNSALSSPNSLNHLNKLSSLASNNALLPNSSSIQAAAANAALAAVDSLRYNGAFNMANVLNGHRLFNAHQNNLENLQSKEEEKSKLKLEHSTLNHLGNLEGLFHKVGNKASFSIDHLLNSNKDTQQEMKKSASPNLHNHHHHQNHNQQHNSLTNGSQKSYQDQLMAAARQQLAAFTALGFGLNSEKTMSSDASAAQLSEFYNQFIGANNYMNAAAAALNNFSSFRHLNQNDSNQNHQPMPNPFTSSFHQQAANLLSSAGSANLTPPPNSNSPMNEDEKVCVDEQVDEKKERVGEENDEELRSAMHSPFSVVSGRSGRSSTVNIEEDCD